MTFSPPCLVLLTVRPTRLVLVTLWLFKLAVIHEIFVHPRLIERLHLRHLAQPYSRIVRNSPSLIYSNLEQEYHNSPGVGYCFGSSGAVHSVFLIDVYLVLESPRGSGFWVGEGGRVTEGNKEGVSLQASGSRGGRVLTQEEGSK